MIVDFAEPWTMDFADKAGSRFRKPLRLAPCFDTLSGSSLKSECKSQIYLQLEWGRMGMGPGTLHLMCSHLHNCRHQFSHI